MTKAEFVAKVAAKLDITAKHAAENVDAVFSELETLLKAGDNLTIVGFGKFSVSERGARTGRNPQTGAEIQIAASKAGKFSAGKNLKNL